MRIMTARTAYSTIGWRENIGLPAMGISSLKAKIDTGARTSALHANVIGTRAVDGRRMVEFDLPAALKLPSRRRLMPVVDKRDIKNTSGIAEKRYVIETLLVLGDRRWKIEITLADRNDMTFEMIIGRTAIRDHRLLVDPSRSFLLGTPGRPRASKV
jgi:hypothetical protein